VLKDSPPISESEQDLLDQNHVTVARRGREPGLTLSRDGRSVPLEVWAAELLDSMTGICEVLDRGDAAKPYTTALAAQRAKLVEVRLTPSARLLAELRSTGESFVELALRMSTMHKAYFRDLHTPNPQRLTELSAEAEESLRKQREIEAKDRISFEAYLANYFS
jgi:glutamate--cysteine ligase